jgi:hypothetical protein
MISGRDNEILTRVGPDTPMGRTMRRYWLPVCTSAQLPEPDSNRCAWRCLARRIGDAPECRARIRTSPGSAMP